MKASVKLCEQRGAASESSTLVIREWPFCARPWLTQAADSEVQYTAEHLTGVLMGNIMERIVPFLD